MLIVSLNSFDLLESSVRFLFRVDVFYHERDLDSVQLIVMINSVVCIAVVSQKSSNTSVELVEMFFLEVLDSHSCDESSSASIYLSQKSISHEHES